LVFAAEKQSVTRVSQIDCKSFLPGRVVMLGERTWVNAFSLFGGAQTRLNFEVTGGR